MKNAEYVFPRLDQAFQFWEEEVWQIRTWRDISKISGYKESAFGVAEGYPFDGTEKTKDRLLRAISNPDLSDLLPDLLNQYPKQPHPGIIRGEIQNLKSRLGLQLGAKEKRERDVIQLWGVAHFPYYLGRWNSLSRRVYLLSKELSEELQATSFGDMTLNDVKMPFDSFGIAFEEPVMDGERPMDFILVGELSGRCLGAYFLSRELADWRKPSHERRLKIDEAVKKGNLARALKFGVKNLGRPSTELIRPYVNDFVLESGDIKLSRLFEDSNGGGIVAKFHRILLGLCLYLKNYRMSGVQSHQGLSWEKMARSSTPGPAVTSSLDVCKVQITSTPTPENAGNEEEEGGGSGREVRPHFREGYWRRANGTGHDPDAPKVVWVRPTLVRKDRLPKDALPLGVGKVLS